MLTSGKGDWARLKADHEEDYKQLPIDPHDHQTAIAAIRGPRTGRRRDVLSRTLSFGPIEALLRYIVLSTIATSMGNRYLVTP